MISRLESIKLLRQNAPLSSLMIIVWLILACLGPLFVHPIDEGILPSLIPYSPEQIDLDNANAVGPFEKQKVAAPFYRHWLGTDELGRDVLAQLIHGSRTALLVGLGSITLAAIIGICLGLLAAYWGDHRLFIRRKRLYPALLLLTFLFIYGLAIIQWNYLNAFSSFLLLGGIITIAVLCLKWLMVAPNSKSKSILLPLDLIIGRMIELMESLPLLFIIVSLSALLKPGVEGVVLIIGLSNWAVVARYTRAEALKIREQSFVEAARASALGNKRIILNHILPNAIGPVFITIAFGVAAAILIEATLSFLGLGVGMESSSWGAMLAEARRNYEAWWLALFPGLAIFLVVYACNRIGDVLSK